MNATPLPYNPRLDVPFTRCDFCDVSEYDAASTPLTGKMRPMFRVTAPDDVYILCEACKDKELNREDEQ